MICSKDWENRICPLLKKKCIQNKCSAFGIMGLIPFGGGATIDIKTCEILHKPQIRVNSKD